MFQQRLPSEDEISSLPLDFVLESEYNREYFTDQLLSTWIALAESGSLATLPPVPDIVGFASNCIAFFLIYHTNSFLLKFPPGATPDPSTETQSQPSTSTSGSPSKDLSYGDEPPEFTSPDTRDVIGCLYLSLSSAAQSTVDVGIALRPDARGRGYGRAAITKVLRYAFQTLRMHRVVANVFGASLGQSSVEAKASAKESGAVRWVFEKLGFTHEGVNRRASFSATDGTWRDVHMLAMLDTDWALMESRTIGRASISTPWDTLMERHEKEREEMSEWMDDPSWGRLRRMGSTETIKGAIEPDVDDVVAEPSANADTQNTLSENDRIGIPGESFYVEADYGFNDLYSEEDDDDNLAISDSNFQSASSWIPDDYASPALGSQVSSPPAPASSLGISPPASVISLPSDFEWRSVGQSSEPSVISAAPSTTSHASWSQVSPPPPNGAGVSSPPIFSLDEDELIDGSPSDLEGEELGFGLEPRRGH